MSMTPEDRRIVTFYSFKGGVGRTMLLANTAYRLANKHGLRVIAVDWDLEAPGLHRFFGLSSEAAAKANGVLDYFLNWTDAVQRRAPEAPDVTRWIVPILDKKHAPRFGSLSLLTAGRIDEGYDRRLASLDWQEFYKSSGGASAVENLRAQLAGQADVVLIDSRTGFTDAGGICTMQIPDGVVLVTAPNQQSLEGIDRVAHAIAQSPAETRSGRARPRLWFVVSRVPIVEETYLAEQWFKRHESWFAGGKSAKLWLDEDHPEGIRSHKIPHRSRWGFDEAVLSGAADVDPEDLLGASYDDFAETIIRWLRGQSSVRVEALRKVETTGGKKDVAALEAEVGEAERRGDIAGLAASLLGLATKLMTAGKYDQAIRRAEQASGIFLSRGARQQYVLALFVLGWALNNRQRHSEASETLTRALHVSREISGHPIEIYVIEELARAHLEQGLRADAERACSEAYALSENLEDNELHPNILLLIGRMFIRLGFQRRAIEPLYRSARIARAQTVLTFEAYALEELLEISDAGERLEDVEALRARLAELKSASAEEPVKHAAAKKRPRKKKT